MVIYQSAHAGQLLSIDLGNSTWVSVNGCEIFTDKSIASTFRCRPSTPKIKGIYGNHQGQPLALFSQPFCFQLNLPEDDNPLRYQVSIDGISVKAQETPEISIPIDFTDDLPHCLRIIDMEKQAVKLQYHFAILKGCSWQFSQGFYRNQFDAIQGTLQYAGSQHDIRVATVSDHTNALFTIPSIPFQIGLKTPLISCTYGEKTCFLHQHIFGISTSPKELY